jgi:hypothetical protein
MKSRYWKWYETWLFVLIVVWLACKVGAAFGQAPRSPKPLQYALAAVDDRRPDPAARAEAPPKAGRYYDVRQAKNGRWFAVVSDGGLYPEDIVWDVLDRLNDRQPPQAKRGYGCSPSCTCGCQEGGPCECGKAKPHDTAQGAIDSTVAWTVRLQSVTSEMLARQARYEPVLYRPAYYQSMYQPTYYRLAYYQPSFQVGRRGGSC